MMFESIGPPVAFALSQARKAFSFPSRSAIMRSMWRTRASRFSSREDGPIRLRDVGIDDVLFILSPFYVPKYTAMYRYRQAIFSPFF
jgi:hypothetical protein